MSNVVSKTRNRLMPSMPTIYSMPKAGIQGMRSIDLHFAAGAIESIENPSDQKKSSGWRSVRGQIAPAVPPRNQQQHGRADHGEGEQAV